MPACIGHPLGHVGAHYRGSIGATEEAEGGSKVEGSA